MYNVYSKVSVLQKKDELCQSFKTIDEARDYCKRQDAKYDYTTNGIEYYRCNPVLKFYIVKE